MLVVIAVSSVAAQDQGPTAKPFAITMRRYAFDPPRIEVNQDDLVKIELRSEDIAHSLTIDEYRISKRVNPHQPVTFEFRADRPGTFSVLLQPSDRRRLPSDARPAHRQTAPLTRRHRFTNSVIHEIHERSRWNTLCSPRPYDHGPGSP